MLCPFLSTNGRVDCVKSCALNINGNCVFRSVGQDSLLGFETVLTLSKMQGLDTIVLFGCIQHF